MECLLLLDIAFWVRLLNALVLWSMNFAETMATHIIIAAIPLPRLERGSSGLSFSYSLYGVLFLICSQMAIDILEKKKEETLLNL